ncbi:hypothetical protein BU26DRAFT_30329 [Trematosphaeria pertusa]|uniref:Uncharacterized protein n=1 Tax=Trematosphaeria pertusa TaxID=390896 RepID=A0A6A6J2G9_9PLEO|nr:uncharacterized protein BU26DRAFT_30329 [Trematosphaeria pertusa]KAF2256836.1 hypothetical protein BU26DRAFT_30329 [Trematosphaeria pertusa]
MMGDRNGRNIQFYIDSLQHKQSGRKAIYIPPTLYIQRSDSGQYPFHHMRPASHVHLHQSTNLPKLVPGQSQRDHTGRRAQKPTLHPKGRGYFKPADASASLSAPHQLAFSAASSRSRNRKGKREKARRKVINACYRSAARANARLPPATATAGPGMHPARAGGFAEGRGTRRMSDHIQYARHVTATRTCASIASLTAHTLQRLGANRASHGKARSAAAGTEKGNGAEGMLEPCGVERTSGTDIPKEIHAHSLQSLECFIDLKENLARDKENLS